MRNASRPRRPSVGTRSKKAMSSSIVMTVQGLAVQGLAVQGLSRDSRHQLIAAGLGDQDSRRGGILLDLLAQPVDVRLQRVGGDARIVAPDFLQQGLARNRPLARTVEVAEDRGLLLGQPHFVTLGVEKEL